MSITLRNPHSALSVLKSRPKDVLGLNLPQKFNPTGSAGSSGAANDAWEKVAKLALEYKISITHKAPAQKVSQRPQNAQLNSESSRLSTAEMLIREKNPVSLEELFHDAPSRKGGKGLWLALDNLQDPHNVGAIFRTAAFFGVEGIILTQDRSTALTGTVYDVASGGVESIPFVMQGNLQRAFEKAKENGLWILGTSEHAHDHYRSVPRDRPWLLVLGNEEKGMRRLTAESCDVLCGIAPLGEVGSLNVSVAAGVLISWFSGG